MSNIYAKKHFRDFNIDGNFFSSFFWHTMRTFRRETFVCQKLIKKQLKRHYQKPSNKSPFLSFVFTNERQPICVARIMYAIVVT